MGGRHCCLPCPLWTVRFAKGSVNQWQGSETDEGVKLYLVEGEQDR